MAKAMTAEQFEESPGVGEWRAKDTVASATYRTNSFARGVEFIDAIGSLADSANHHPDVDLRYSLVTVRLTTHDVGALSELDVALARRISQAARDLGIVADENAIDT